MTSSALVERVRDTLMGPCGVVRGQALLLGCSGGADSMALLDLMGRLAAQERLELTVATVDHALRDVGAELSLVRDACACRGIPWVSLAVVIDGAVSAASGLEAAARHARRRALLGQADRVGAAAVVLAHQRDDQAETVLMRAMVGTGVRGLAAMRPRSGRFVRPLLAVGREQLRTHLVSTGCPWCEDPTNDDPRFLRNRVRNELMPLMRSIVGDGLSGRLAALAERCAADDLVLEQRAHEAVDAATGPGGVRAAALAHHAPAIQVRAVLALVRRGAPGTGPGRVHVEAMLDLLGGVDRCAGVDLPGRIRLERQGDVLAVVESRGDAAGAAADPGSIALEVPGVTVWPPLNLVIRARVHDEREAVGRGADAGTGRAWFDLDRLTRPLRVQTFAPGARIKPMGSPGSRKVSDVLGEAGVPRRQRTIWPMVMDAQRVIWVPGGRAADVAAVDDQTTRILELVLEVSR